MGFGASSRRALRWIWNALAIAGALFLIIELTPVTRYWATKLGGPASNAPGAVLIVLGSDRLSDSIIEESSYWRAVYALRAFREGRYQRILISGGVIGVGAPVAEVIRDFLVGSGVPAEVIVTEIHSQSTRENAVLVAELLRGEPGTKVLLTSDYHMWRALRCFKKVGMDVRPLPIPDALKQGGRLEGRWPAFYELVEESVKIFYYRARGWI